MIQIKTALSTIPHESFYLKSTANNELQFSSELQRAGRFLSGFALAKTWLCIFHFSILNVTYEDFKIKAKKLTNASKSQEQISVFFSVFGSVECISTFPCITLIGKQNSSSCSQIVFQIVDSLDGKCSNGSLRRIIKISPKC